MENMSKDLCSIRRAHGRPRRRCGWQLRAQEITQWLASNATSQTNLYRDQDPLSNITVKQQIEHLVASGELDDQLCANYLDRK